MHKLGSIIAVISAAIAHQLEAGETCQMLMVSQSRHSYFGHWRGHRHKHRILGRSRGHRAGRRKS